MSGARVVSVPVGDVDITGDLVAPPDATGLVLFAHGSGSSRHSARNRLVAATLQEAGVATLLMDLLTQEEASIDARTAQFRFHIPLLASRVVASDRWAAREPTLAGLPVGLFGASTGAAAALVASAEHPHLARAVVSRGGRPDLAGEALPRVSVPTLLIVGGADTQVLALNRAALQHLTVNSRLEVVPDATHLFEEEGALEQVARLAADWFLLHFREAGDRT